MNSPAYLDKLYFPYEETKAMNLVNYILIKLGNKTDLHELFKVIYHAEKLHLCQYGYPLIGETYKRLQFGPVPNNIYTYFNDLKFEPSTQTNIKINDYILEGKDLLYDPDIFSSSNIEVVDEAIGIIKGKTFAQRTEFSHDSAWENTSPKANYKIKDILKAGNANEDLIEFVMENLENANIMELV